MAEKMITPEMINDARRLEREEAIRDGSYVPDEEAGPEKFNGLPKSAIKKIPVPVARQKFKRVDVGSEKPISRLLAAEQELERLNSGKVLSINKSE